MSLLQEKLYDILNLAKSSDLSEIALKYLKDALGSEYEKYIKIEDFQTFQKAFQIDLQTKKLDKISLLEKLFKIYYLHKDLNNAYLFKQEKIKEQKEHQNLKNIAFEYYELANILYDQKNLQEALKYINKAFEYLNLKKLSLVELELYLKLRLIKNQILQDLGNHEEKILKDIDQITDIFENVKNYFPKTKQKQFQIHIFYLYLSYYLLIKETKKAKEYIPKILKLIDNASIKNFFKYKIYETIAFVYLFEEEFQNAIEYAKKAISLKNKLININIFSALVIISQAYLALKEFDEALNFAHQANEYVNDSIKKLTFLYELLAKIYKAKRDEKRTKEYLLKLCHLKDIEQKK